MVSKLRESVHPAGKFNIQLRLQCVCYRQKWRRIEKNVCNTLRGAWHSVANGIDQGCAWHQTFVECNSSDFTNFKSREVKIRHRTKENSKEAWLKHQLNARAHYQDRAPPPNPW